MFIRTAKKYGVYSTLPIWVFFCLLITNFFILFLSGFDIASYQNLMSQTGLEMHTIMTWASFFLWGLVSYEAMPERCDWKVFFIVSAVTVLTFLFAFHVGQTRN